MLGHENTVAVVAASTTPEQALADADTDLVDDRGSAYVMLGVAGGSDGELGYAARSTFVPAIPVGARELVFRVGRDSVRLRRDR